MDRAERPRDRVGRSGEPLDSYTSVFGYFAYIPIGIGVVLLIFSGKLNKMMHGVK